MSLDSNRVSLAEFYSSDRERRAERRDSRESKLRVSAARESGMFKVHALCIISIKLPRTIVAPYTRDDFSTPATLYTRVAYRDKFSSYYRISRNGRRGGTNASSDIEIIQVRVERTRTQRLFSFFSPYGAQQHIRVNWNFPSLLYYNEWFRSEI